MPITNSNVAGGLCEQCDCDQYLEIHTDLPPDADENLRYKIEYQCMECGKIYQSDWAGPIDEPVD